MVQIYPSHRVYKNLEDVGSYSSPQLPFLSSPQQYLLFYKPLFIFSNLSNRLFSSASLISITCECYILKPSFLIMYPKFFDGIFQIVYNSYLSAVPVNPLSHYPSKREGWTSTCVIGRLIPYSMAGINRFHYKLINYVCVSIG